MRIHPLTTGVLAAGLLLGAAGAWAEPIVPGRDDEVIEVLPAAAGDRAEDKRLRRELAARPNDVELAVRVARRELDRARLTGDPRFAGLALSALRSWPDATKAPAEVLLTQATLQQYLHDFDASVATLRLLLARPGEASWKSKTFEPRDLTAPTDRANPRTRKPRRSTHFGDRASSISASGQPPEYVDLRSRQSQRNSHLTNVGSSD